MARTNAGPGDGPQLATSGESQKQSTSAEPEQKRESPEKADGIQFFDTTIAKIRTDENGEEVEVMSDHLMPGEKLKRAVDDEKLNEKLEQRRKDAEKDAK